MATEIQKLKVQEAAIKLAFAKAAYEDAQKDFDKIFDEVTGVQPVHNGAGDVSTFSSSPSSKTAVEQVAQVLESNKTKDFTYKEIEQATKLPMASIKQYLWRLNYKGRAEKAGRGLWRSTQSRPVK